MLHKIMRGALSALGALMLVFAAATALEAECVEYGGENDDIICTSCGENTCCHTHWHGDQLISSWCHAAVD